MARRNAKQAIGIGIYTPSEAAYYARVHPSTMRRWIHGNRAGEPVVHAQLTGDPERTVTFLDLVQALAVRAVRREHRVPLPKIRAAVDHARDRYGVEYPFAMHHRTFLFGNEILIELPKRGGLVQLSGKHRDQHVMREVAELYMEDLTFAKDGLAVEYSAFKHDRKEVIINPILRLGQPVVKTCSYTVSALLEAYRTEGSIARAAKTYGVEPKDVELAIRYDDYLRGATAA